MRALKKFTKKTLILGGLVFQAGISMACGTGGLKTVSHVDLNRYMGDWYVIANIPNLIEKNCSNSIESYALRPDGKIDNWFTCQKDKGTPLKLTSVASVKNTLTNAEWRIRFNIKTFLGNIPAPIRFSYLILDLDTENYNYTVVGHPSKSLLWIMSKSKTLDETTYQQILSRLKDQGYDLNKIVKVTQTP